MCYDIKAAIIITQGFSTSSMTIPDLPDSLFSLISPFWSAWVRVLYPPLDYLLLLELLSVHSACPLLF